VKKNKKFTDLVQKIFGKAQDDAIKALDEAADESGDESEEGKEKKVGDKDMYDELMKAVKDLGAKVEKLAGAKDESDEGDDGDEEKENEEKPKDEEDPMATLMSRLDACEAAIKKLVAGEVGEDESDESGDEDKDKDVQESGDESDTADTSDSARAEILAPGIDKKAKNLKARALKSAYGTKDGKICIESLTGGKAPKLDKKETVDMLFSAASELMKSNRRSKLASTKTGDEQIEIGKGPMTPEKLNEINAKHYGRKA
jgi:hypothetical protein